MGHRQTDTFPVNLSTDGDPDSHARQTYYPQDQEHLDVFHGQYGHHRLQRQPPGDKAYQLAKGRFPRP